MGTKIEISWQERMIKYKKNTILYANYTDEIERSYLCMVFFTKKIAKRVFQVLII